MASTAAVSIEVESGVITEGATILNDARASGRKLVQLNTPPTGDETKFSLAVIPDTQFAVAHWPDDFTAMTQWIAGDVQTDNIKYVLHEGDIQDYPKNTRQYPLAQASMNVLDGKVPYIVTIGNHDFDRWSDGGERAIKADRSTLLFNTFFPVAKFAAWPTFGSSYPVGTNDNAYHRFSAGGTDWGIVTLKYEPTDQEIAWANGIIANNPKRRFIILTHEFLGTGSRNETGNNIWNNLAKKYSNVSFVFSGHVPSQTSNRRVDDGVNGNPVHQMLFDYQKPNSRNPNTYFRMLYFDTAAKTIRVKTYSPVLNDYRTEPKEQFTITDAPIDDLN